MKTITTLVLTVIVLTLVGCASQQHHQLWQNPKHFDESSLLIATPQTGRILCPECGTWDIRYLYSTSTLMAGAPPYQDSTGVWHYAPDPNTTTNYYRCVHGHEFHKP
jgi:hypothetical protein